MAKAPISKTIETLKHDDAKRKNIPTAEHQSIIQKEQENPKKVRYLVWRNGILLHNIEFII